jgi:hypothetical protein
MFIYPRLNRSRKFENDFVGRLHSRLLWLLDSHRVYTLPFSGSYLSFNGLPKDTNSLFMFFELSLNIYLRLYYVILFFFLRWINIWSLLLKREIINAWTCSNTSANEWSPCNGGPIMTYTEYWRIQNHKRFNYSSQKKISVCTEWSMITIWEIQLVL